MSIASAVISGVLIIFILILAAVLLYFILRPPKLVFTPFAPSGSVVRLKNKGTGEYLGICSTTAGFVCNGVTLTGSYATTHDNTGNTDGIKWVVNVDQLSQYMAFQNVEVQHYLSNLNGCSGNPLVGQILSVELNNLPAFDIKAPNGYFGSILISSNSVQLVDLNNGSYVGTIDSNTITDSCQHMVTDGFVSAEIDQTEWIFEILSTP